MCVCVCVCVSGRAREVFCCSGYWTVDDGNERVEEGDWMVVAGREKDKGEREGKRGGGGGERRAREMGEVSEVVLGGGVKVMC